MIFSEEEIYKAVKHYMPTVNEYVKSHGGNIKLLGVKDNTVYIAIQDQTNAYQRLEKDVIARRKVAGATCSFKIFGRSQVHFFLIVRRISHK